MRRLALALLLAAGHWAQAVAHDVDLELVLLADASGSIGAGELDFQRQGYATAITDPEVVAAIQGTAYGRIAVTYVEWAAAGTEAVIVPWRVLAGPQDAARFAADLLPPPRRAWGRNAIGSALLTGKRLIEDNDIDGWRRVIDFSGDSVNNWNGPGIEEARAEVLAAGITINALAILCRACGGRPASADLPRAYRQRIAGGPGAFVVTAEDEAHFAAAVKRKLILEISGPSGRPASRTAAR